MVSFGAPQGQRVGDAAKAMAFHAQGAATPPMVLSRPNPKGIFQIANFLARPGPDAKASAPGARHGYPPQAAGATPQLFPTRDTSLIGEP